MKSNKTTLKNINIMHSKIFQIATTPITPDEYACNGKDESDKRLFLESEGFHVAKRWIYGRGDVLEITY